MQLHLHQRFGEEVVRPVATGEAGVVLQERLQAIDGARIPALLEVEHADFVLVRAQAIARFAQPLPALVHQRAVRIALDERLELVNRFARFALIALRLPHLLVVRHPELQLRVVGARAGRIERQELAELVHREDQRFRAALAEIGIADAKLGIGPVIALRIGIEDAPEVFARVQPAVLLERFIPLVVEELVGLGGTLRHHVFLAAARRRGHREADDEQKDRTDEFRQHHASTGEDDSQRYSAARPSASDVAGAKPSSARARDVSA